MRGGVRSAAVIVAAGTLVGVAAHIHAQTPGGQVTQVAYLKASNPGMGDHFACGTALDGHAGIGIAISGDGTTMAVGAPHESSDARGVNGDQNNDRAYSSGAVYVFTRAGNGAWTQQAYIKASNPGDGDDFGHVVAISADGNTLAVSAYYESSGAKGINGDQNNDSTPQSGAVYVFTRAGGRWSQQAYIKASNTGEAGEGDNFGDGDQFGFSLTISDDGNTIAAGATAEDSGSATDQNDNSKMSAGAVYVFSRCGTAWTQQAYLKPSNIDGGDQFGYSVSLSADGNVLAAGSYDEGGSARVVDGPQDNMRNGSGAVYIFARSGGAWKQTNYLKPTISEGGDSFGVSVALSDDGNTIAIGALDEDCPASGVNPPNCDNDRAADTSTGAAYVFVRSGTTWMQQAFFKQSNTKTRGDWFGTRLALSGDGNTMISGATLEDGGSRGIDGNQEDRSKVDAGAGYLFTRTGNTWRQLAYVKSSNSDAGDEFAGALALSRDGRTLALGARTEDGNARGVNGNQADNSVADSGAVYMFAIGGAAAGSR
jgi:hypothetical protein